MRRFYLCYLLVAILREGFQYAVIALQHHPSHIVSKSLYSENDPILQLNGGDSFQGHVLNSNSSTFLEYYMSWCGHCRRFAPSYVNFADDVKGWRQIVKIAAINCAEDDNRDICDANGIKLVPHIKYYPRWSQSYEQGIAVHAQHTAEDIRKVLVKHILTEFSENKYRDWPMFEYLPQYTSIAAVFSTVDSHIPMIGIVFEKSPADNVTSAEVLLDVHNQKNIVFRRAEAGHPLLSVLGPVELPAILIFMRGSSVPISQFTLHNVSRADIKSLYWLISKDDVANVKTTTKPSTFSSRPPANLDSNEIAKKFYVSETDLLLALHYVLKKEVTFKRHPIKGEKLKALKNFINILAKYYPQSDRVRYTMNRLSIRHPQLLPQDGRLARVRGLLAELSQWLGNSSAEYQHENWSLEPVIWKKKLSQLEEKYDNPFPIDAEWKHCRGSSDNFRGYTCGLWTNLHAITVHAYLTDGLGSAAVTFNPLSVLYSVRDFIRHFFSCAECSEHFMTMATETLRLEDWVRYPSDVVLWLWRAHNQVNRRLAGDDTEDPEYPKRQFPPDFLCTRCNRGNNWALREVMRYLSEYYTNIRLDAD